MFEKLISLFGGSGTGPTVSIIVPVYNCERYLQDFLDSILGQTFDDVEIIFVNDGSTDGSLDILNDAAVKDKRIKVLSQPNSGAAAARNLGLEKANGEYLIWLDADDMVEPEIIESMVAAFSLDPSIDTVICAIDEYIEEDDAFRDATWAVDSHIPANVPFDPKNIERLFEHVCGYPWNKMFKKSMIDEYHLRYQEGLKIHEDMSFAQSALALSNKAFFVDSPMCHHRLHANKDSSTNTNKDLYECMLLALEQIKDALHDADIFQEYEHAYANYALQQSHWKYGVINADAKRHMVDDLRNGWLNRLGISGYPSDFFANTADVEFMERILNDPKSL